MINDFGHKSFVTHTTGLKERIQKAEKEKDMRNYRGLTKEGKLVYGWYKYHPYYDIHIIQVFNKLENVDGGGIWLDYEVIPETVGQDTGLCYEGDYVVMDCWNGGDGIDEPNIHDTFEGVVIYDKKICRFGLQTKICDEGQIEVGLEDNRFTSIEIIDNKWENPELMEQDNESKNQR